MTLLRLVARSIVIKVFHHVMMGYLNLSLYLWHIMTEIGNLYMYMVS